uniref:Uncharacterized protein n=1 Tax=Anguilla anguilla TaxID=7936 RepID=A0A0E9R482_ANGAN
MIFTKSFTKKGVEKWGVLF